MKKILVLLLLLSAPAFAQYNHRSNPGAPGTTASGISATGYAAGVCLDTSGADTVFVAVTGTWVATLQFVGTNDSGVTLKALNAVTYSATGGVGTTVATTTANGDFLIEVSPFRQFCVTATAFTSNASMAVRIDADPAAYFAMAVGVGFNGATAPPRLCDKTKDIVTLGTTATVQQIAGVAGQNIYICGMILNASTAAAGTTLVMVEGTGANCVTAPATVGSLLAATPTAAPTTPQISTLGPAMRVTATAGDALCLQQGQAVNSTSVIGTIFYTQN